MVKALLILTLIFVSSIASAQSRSLDLKRIANFRNFIDYLQKRDTSKIDTSIIFQIYVDVAYIRPDTSSSRLKRRLAFMKQLFINLKKISDTLQIENFNAVNFADFHFQNSKQYEELDDIKDQVYVYFLKTNPHLPLGLLLFAPNSDKVYSWILINQGGYHYFLMLNLI